MPRRARSLLHAQPRSVSLCTDYCLFIIGPSFPAVSTLICRIARNRDRLSDFVARFLREVSAGDFRASRFIKRMWHETGSSIAETVSIIVPLAIGLPVPLAIRLPAPLAEAEITPHMRIRSTSALRLQ